MSYWDRTRSQPSRPISVSESAGRLGSPSGSRFKAIYQVESGIPLAKERDQGINNGEQGGIKLRNSYVGLKSDFGTTPLKVSRQQTGIVQRHYG